MIWEINGTTYLSGNIEMDIDKEGWLNHKKITKEHRDKLEHGAIASIKAIVLHRTATANAKPCT